MAKYHVLSEEGDVSFIADQDLTAKQYTWVGPASTYNNVASVSGASPAPFGILQNSPSLGQEARVRVFGFSKAWTNATACVAQWGSYVVVASDGRTERLLSATCLPCFGRYIGSTSAAGASYYGEVFIFGAGIQTCPVATS